MLPRRYKNITLALGRRAVDVTVKFAMLEVLQRPKHIADMEEILHEILHFIQTETQLDLLHHHPLGITILTRYFTLEQRLGSMLVNAWQYHMGIQAYDKTVVPEQMTSLHSRNNANIVKCGEMFSNAHDFVVNGGNYYSGRIFIQQPLDHESSQIIPGIIPGIHVIPFEDILITREIHRNRGYRLHSDNSSVKARVVKVYQGPRAKERAQAAANFNIKVMHPSFLHMIGVSPLDSEVPFLVFNGEFKGTLEGCIASALKKNIRKSLILGLQTVACVSSGLGYLSDIGYSFVSAGLEHFDVFLNLEGNIIISFDPDIGHDNSNEDHTEEGFSSSKMDNPLLIFHELVKQKFNAACQAYYEQQQVERICRDILENETFASGRFEEENENSDLEPDNNPSNSSTTPSPSHGTSSLPKKPQIDGRRRELVWKCENAQNLALEDISREFKAFLAELSESSALSLRRRRGRYTTTTAHRCPGYNRTEIILTPNITSSAIVSHSTPLPHEICPVCKEVVMDAEIFNCICGNDDNECVPTIQCSKCYEWHHRPCVASIMIAHSNFTCPDCLGTNPVREYAVQDRSYYMPSSPPLSGDFFASCIIARYFREKFRLFPDSGPTLRVPLLVWVDDKPENNTYEVVQARQMGIFVIELSSIAAAQAWVKANEGFLRDNDDASCIRFISDNALTEPGARGQRFLNKTAGKTLLEYLRSQLFECPFLIYTGPTEIFHTDYVRNHKSAGSTVSRTTCLQYISSLAEGRNDDTSWTVIRLL